ncbi:MAG: hypothetical protein GQ552_04190 [Flavobacteriaceae bacterium]|nr:hypothetical protein [Flavobacteriaceae bacterium]
MLGWLLKQFLGDDGDTSIAPIAAIDAVKDDLTKIEGIGPKIKELLNNDDIWSFYQLSLSASTRVQKILDDAGPAYTVHNPRTWSAQARLADEGHWVDLKIWQDHLKGGL